VSETHFSGIYQAPASGTNRRNIILHLGADEVKGNIGIHTDFTVKTA